MEKALLYTIDGVGCTLWAQLKSEGFSSIFVSCNLCENFFINADLEHLKNEMKKMREVGLETLVSIPPVHERNIKWFDAVLQQLCSNGFVTGFVVNDIGLLVKLREQFQWHGKMLFGRLFDKTVREARFDFMQENKSGSMLTMHVNYQLQKIAGQYQISGMVIDTMTDGILDFREIDSSFQIYLLYPKVMLSKAAYCEFTGYQKDPDDKFLLNERCNRFCRLYRKRIAAEHPIQKEGLLICCTQTRPVHECAVGNYTVVAPKEYWHECNCTYQK